MYAPETKRREDEETADSWFDLADTVGLGRMNGRRDVFKVESILADAGDLDFAGTNGPSGYGQYTLDDGVRKYQKRNGLKVDGWLRPDGPTVTKMREQFGERFAGFPAPTQAQIEQHHSLAAEGQDGLLVARPPRIELKKPKSYPPVDPETHGSNTSWVEFLTRSRTNFDGAPEMLATYIKNFGARGVLQARDFVEQWDAAKPGEGPDVVAAVLRHLDNSVDRRAFVGGDLPQSAPIGTLRPEALQALARAGDAAQPDEGGRGSNIQLAAAGRTIIQGALPELGAIVGGALAKREIDETLKPGQAPSSPPPSVSPSGTSDPLPGRPPAPPSEKLQGTTPAPPIQALPGFPDLTDADREMLKTIPQAPDDVRAEINDLITNVVFNVEYDDRRTDNRGKDSTVDGTNIAAKEFSEALKASRVADIYKHLGGASIDGKREAYLPEKEIETPDGARRPDITMGVEDDKVGKYPKGHINTASTRADGTLTSREQRAIEAIQNAVRDRGLAEAIPKLEEGGDRAEYAKIARAASDRIVRTIEKSVLDSGHTPN
ncbi:MAG: hypothetical protein ACK5U4_17075 [Rhodospirillales bacterium]